MANCATCGAKLPRTARFCPRCGTRIAGAEETAILDTPPHETSAAPVDLMRAEARFYGVTPPIAVLVLAVTALAVAVLLLAQGSAVAGGIVLAASIFLLAFFLVLAKREAVNRARERAGSLVESLTIRSGARRELIRLQHELHWLHGSQERWFYALGRAVYGNSEEEIETAKTALATLSGQIAAKEEQMRTITNEARALIDQSRLQAETTSVIEPQPSPVPDPAGPLTVPEPYPPPDEGDPPQPAPLPEPYPPDEIEPPQQKA